MCLQSSHERVYIFHIRHYDKFSLLWAFNNIVSILLNTFYIRYIDPAWLYDIVDIYKQELFILGYSNLSCVHHVLVYILYRARFSLNYMFGGIEIRRQLEEFDGFISQLSTHVTHFNADECTSPKRKTGKIAERDTNFHANFTTG